MKLKITEDTVLTVKYSRDAEPYLIITGSGQAYRGDRDITVVLDGGVTDVDTGLDYERNCSVRLVRSGGTRRWIVTLGTPVEEYLYDPAAKATSLPAEVITAVDQYIDAFERGTK